MKVITLNVNGIRSAAKKGLYSWLSEQQADIICLQETRSEEHHRQAEVFCPTGYFCYYVDAEKKGYSGVAIYTKKEPLNITRALGWHTCDTEGRFLQLDYAHLSVISLYMPSGTSGEARQAIKFDFLTHFEKYLKTWRKIDREFIICGDWNIAHKAIDLKNWRGNQKNSGFLPEERAWMDRLFDSLGYVDAFRVINQELDQYTWWSHRGRAWEKNVGWRIDYQVITPGLKNKVSRADIYKEQRFSDHAPLTIEYELAL